MMNLTSFEESVREQNLAVRGLIVWRDEEVAARYQPEPEQRQNLYSGTKSFTSTACAFAVQEGLFDMNDYVLNHFAEDAPKEPSENLKKMKLRHLITMSMGFASPMLMGDTRPAMVEKDWVKFVLKAPVLYHPGSVFQYNNAGPYLLGILIQRKAGCSLEEYLRPRLFEPLGITPRPVVEKDPLGNTFGAGGLQLNVTEFSKLGLLYLNHGAWNGKQLISSEWVKAASSPFIKATEGDAEIGDTYGYLFWTMPDGMYRADGKYGQYCIVIPPKKAVIAVTSMQIQDEKKVLRTVLRTVLPLIP